MTTTATSAATTATLRLERYAPNAKELVVGAQSLADRRKHVEVDPIHLLAYAAEHERVVGEILRRAGADPALVLERAERSLARLPRTEKDLSYLSQALLDLLSRAEREAARDGEDRVGVFHLLHALSQELRGAAGEVLSSFGIGPGGFRALVAPFEAELRRDERAPAGNGGGMGPRSGAEPAGGARGASSVLAAPAVAGVSDLLARARADELGPVIGREAELGRVLYILERHRRGHVLVVGEPGVGKTSLVSGLAKGVAAGEAGPSLGRSRLVQVEIAAVTTGCRTRSEIEERIGRAVANLFDAAPSESFVLVVEDIESAFSGSVPGAVVAEFIRPLVGRAGARLIATTTPEGLRRLEDRDPALARCFTIVRLEAPTIEAATQMVRGVASVLERHYGVGVSESAIVAAPKLARRYLQDRVLPDSALDLLDETLARACVVRARPQPELDAVRRRLAELDAQAKSLADDEDEVSRSMHDRIRGEMVELERQLGAARTATDGAGTPSPTTNAASHRTLQAERPIIGESDVAATLAEWTGIPVQRMLEAEAEKLMRMEERLSRRVVGQSEAVRALARAVRRGRVGLRDPRRPIGSFLFLGPSGVGKTELAKALAEFLFDDELALTRLDMSEFMERHMAQRLLGAPPGYVDSEQGGFLTEAVRRRPYSVLLFDEVEKAHADVFNLLLQVLDDGRLTDGRGRTADFTNTVVIMTSNIGSQRILDAEPRIFETEEGREALRDVLVQDLRAFFRPEFLNRVDDTLVFRPLTRADLRGIVDIQLAKIAGMLADRRLSLEVSDPVKDALVELAYEPAFGARPLKRVLLRRLQDPLAEEILAGGYHQGDRVHVELAPDGALLFRRLSAAD